ncbi:hypothetical protein [Aliarcobacter lanthieri]|uniref:hypothetical protein n=1 Tax=Aliarcobacter lanthieri TaxID=1355374 RepID=UPI00047D5ACB|nr:hypothetical protein [Aliarcobacter lanthieri]QKF58968.1 putative membrane protein [Aliarcobacter lanthieri]
MKTIISRSKSLLLLFFVLLVSLLIILSSNIEKWHIDGSIYWIASDAPVYYNALEIFTLEEFFNNWDWFINLSLVFNVQLIGNITLYLIIVMFLCLLVVKYSLKFIKPKYKLFYLLLLLIFPYANITFFSINKEVFMFYSVVLFSCYYLNKSIQILLFSLLLAFSARSYLMISLILMLFIFPVRYKPRWSLLLLTMICLSILPFVLSKLVGFSTDFIDGEIGGMAILFSSLIREGLYMIVYPFKYLILMLSKTYQGFNVGFNFNNRPQDLHEFFVSFLSFLVFCYSLYIYIFKRKFTDTRFFYLALFSPILLQFSDIFHWRYSAFVYVFFVFYIISYKNGLRYYLK